MMKNCLKVQKELVMFLPLKASVHSILTSLFQFTIFKSKGPKMDPSSPKNLQYVIFFITYV